MDLPFLPAGWFFPFESNSHFYGRFQFLCQCMHRRLSLRKEGKMKPFPLEGRSDWQSTTVIHLFSTSRHPEWTVDKQSQISCDCSVQALSHVFCNQCLAPPLSVQPVGTIPQMPPLSHYHPPLIVHLLLTGQLSSCHLLIIFLFALWETSTHVVCIRISKTFTNSFLFEEITFLVFLCFCLPRIVLFLMTKAVPGPKSRPYQSHRRACPA